MYNPFIDIYAKMKQEAKKNMIEICQEWHNRETFEQWASKQNWSGKEVVLISRFGKYQPDNCIFVSAWFAKFLKSKNFDASMLQEKGSLSISNPLLGKTEYIGTFHCPIEAEIAWKKRKMEIGMAIIESEPGNPDKEKLRQAVASRFQPFEDEKRDPSDIYLDFASDDL